MQSLRLLNNISRRFVNVTKRTIFSVDTAYKGHNEQKNNSNDDSGFKQFKRDIRGEVVYGVHPVQMALLAQRRSFNHLYVNENVFESDRPEIADIFNRANKLSIPITIQKNVLLSKLVKDRPHQGFCLDANKLQYHHTKSEIVSEMNKVQRLVILDSIQDPQNFGAILRSCYYFGYTKVLTSCTNSSGLTSTVSKASSGALELIDIYSVPDLVEFLAENVTKDWLLIGTSSSNETYNLRLEDVNTISDKKIAIAFGNEGTGISESLSVLCHKHVTIPATHEPNLIGSLNVSVATGIILHALKSCQDCRQ